MTTEGFLLINKPKGKTSFSLVTALRRRLNVKTIGHAGTLDPFATGVMILLVGKQYTKLSNQFLCQDKEYLAKIHLGVVTSTYDCEGEIKEESPLIPTIDELNTALKSFQGEIDQVPPMFSAKKVKGQKLCNLARKGITVERAAVKVIVETELLSYSYPFVELKIRCSKGTYIRSIAHDLGFMLKCGAHLHALERIRSGLYHLNDCIDGNLLNCQEVDLSPFFRFT